MWVLTIILGPIMLFFALLVFGETVGDTINSFVSGLATGIKYSVYACLLLFFLFILLGLFLLISELYNRCKTKGEKIFLSFSLTGLFLVLSFVVLCKINTTNITVVNERKNDIITEMNIVTIGNEAY